MFDQLDSRALRRTDCYGQRFMKDGTYEYNVLPAFSDFVNRDRPFKIIVAQKKGKEGMAQHNVVVKIEKDQFTVDQPEICIEAGDLVLWNCPDSGARPYCVAGEKDFFSSARMLHECGYTHIFGLPGEYRWRDAYGSDIRGVVRVREPQCKDPAQFRRWRDDILKKGTVVMIAEGKAKPLEVEIVTGQTVFFALTRGPGVAITDERLLCPGKPPEKTKRKA